MKHHMFTILNGYLLSIVFIFAICINRFHLTDLFLFYPAQGNEQENSNLIKMFFILMPASVIISESILFTFRYLHFMWSGNKQSRIFNIMLLVIFVALIAVEMSLFRRQEPSNYKILIALPLVNLFYLFISASCFLCVRFAFIKIFHNRSHL